MASNDNSQKDSCEEITISILSEKNKLKRNSDNLLMLSQHSNITTTAEQHTSIAQSDISDASDIKQEEDKSYHDHVRGSPDISQESKGHSPLIVKDGEDITATVSNKSQQEQQQQTGIPDNILSPPKSETQTDETNTATSSSPASVSQLSPTEEMAPDTPTTPDISLTVENQQSQAPGDSHVISQAINVVANGVIPNSGKPRMSAMNKKLNKSSSSRSTRHRKSKPLVAMYESEISDYKIGIKLCIKKSDSTSTSAASMASVAAAAELNSQVTVASSKTASSKASTRRRSRKSKTRQRLYSDDSEYESKRKKGGNANSSAEQRQKKVGFAAGTTVDKETLIPVEQGDWGARIPEDVLYKIFQTVVDKDGCIPALFRLGRICSLWRRVSLRPSLWKSMDLTSCMKEKFRTELKLKWFIDNRCSSCTDLNVSNWKVADINCFLQKLAAGCPNLMSITLAGWKNFNSDHLTFLVDNMKKLERLDLSSINVEMSTSKSASKSAVGLQSICNALQAMNSRLTHLYLAHNRLAGIPQIVNILSTHCPNLLLLDLSNVHTQATSHGILHIEKLQHGCQKLRVLRVTNSHVTLSTATMQEMMDSPGFPYLEELSVAAVTDESRVMGDEHLQRILKTSSKLKLLDVRGCARLTHESLIRLPAWDIKHLFLSGCSVTRDVGSGLELIASKWAHSLIELDLAWANVQHPLDNALRALAEKGSESPLAHLNLCGSSVSDEAVKDILANCAKMSSINLSSCRGLPRGVKRLMQGPIELQELREVLKVQMKVKLPAQLKREQEAAAVTTSSSSSSMEVDGGGNGSSVIGKFGVASNNSN